ncbi:EAL domain-containing protein [Vibrio fluvialis]|nr:EAL domain-containing protein [Vibrio fluvialis]EKO3549603.1 EAL domain-containing protein [Vibrio fluvialis]EKO3554195.1 EAL domain-containing protein [Vibrio fluvialis]EKO3915649.1 EAL domain-containing protein [Vibrio fluvialis]ELW1731800.1 EAL domain-containing protein [Vibrio fluvialis]
MSRFRSVKLHTKTALLFSLGLMAVIFSCLFVTRYFFLFSINELEDMEIHRASNQAQAVIKSLVNRQEKNSFDWAYWDETYSLLNDENPDYIERNLTEESLDALTIDLMAFLRPNYNLVASLGRSEDAHIDVQSILATPSLSAFLHTMSKRLDSQKSSDAGLVKIGDQVWIISMTPVRDSSGESETVGWMLWGQQLTRTFPSLYQDLLMAQSQLLTDPNAISGVHEAFGVDDNPHSIFRSNQELVHYASIRDMTGSEVAILKTWEPRLYYQKGEHVFYYLIISMLVVTSLISMVVFWLFRDKVGKRFISFEQNIQDLLGVMPQHSDNKQDEFERITQLVESLALSSNQAQDQLKATLQKFEALYHGQSVGMILLSDRVIADVNPATLELLGYQREELIGKTLDAICGTSNAECAVDQFFVMLANGQNKFDTFMQRSDLSEIACSVEATLLQDSDTSSVMLAVQDISEQKQQAELIQTLTQYDPISGLLNRPTLIESVRSLFRNQSDDHEFSIMYFNATRLKEIDEVYGHELYDACVRHIADSLKRYFSREEVGRISESEFVVCCTGPIGRVERMGNHILAAYRAKISLADMELDLGLKGALLPSSIDFENFENIAHCGYYTVMNRNPSVANQLTVVTPEQFERTQEAQILNRDIVAALKNREIIAHYQPIVKAASGQLVGFEALARWKHPQFGMVSPAVFVPLAEQRKLIVELGEQILDQACEFLQTFQQAQAHNKQMVSIHVNISSPHFYHSSLVDTLRKVIDQYQLAAGQLVLELTESILMGVEEETLQRMDAIKALGVQLALDDFGTGYSSFSSLCNFPLDIVKLDKSYIDGLDTNEKAKSLIRNIISMSQELGLTTVAEGVENASQLRKLNVWNVDEIQGYYFYKPMDAALALETFQRG